MAVARTAKNVFILSWVMKDGCKVCVGRREAAAVCLLAVTPSFYMSLPVTTPYTGVAHKLTLIVMVVRTEVVRRTSAVVVTLKPRQDHVGRAEGERDLNLKLHLADSGEN